MKNLSLILNAVLLVAVAVLFYLHFSSASPKKVAGSEAAVSGDLTMAFINSDSLINQYAFIEDRKVILEAKGKKLESDFRNRAETLQSEIAAYQRNESNMTIGQAKALQEDLGKKQQNLQLFEQRINQELSADQQKLMKELYDRLQAFLKTYCEQNNVQMVVKYDLSSDVMYGKPALDITEAVVSGLNGEYADEKNGTKAKADTTKSK
jgi:outer membrane protein